MIAVGWTAPDTSELRSTRKESGPVGSSNSKSSLGGIIFTSKIRIFPAFGNRQFSKQKNSGVQNFSINRVVKNANTSWKVKLFFVVKHC